MATIINTYLTFDGNCEEAFGFYKSVFGGEYGYVGRYKDFPADANSQIPVNHMNRIMHISLPISKETILMGSDTGGEWAANYTPGNNFSISINCTEKEEVDRLFAALSSGGTITMPMEKTFWGDYFGMCTDQFGINWMFSYNEQVKN